MTCEGGVIALRTDDLCHRDMFTAENWISSTESYVNVFAKAHFERSGACMHGRTWGLVLGTIQAAGAGTTLLMLAPPGIDTGYKIASKHCSIVIKRYSHIVVAFSLRLFSDQCVLQKVSSFILY